LEGFGWDVLWQPVTAETVQQAEGLLLTNASSGFRPVSEVNEIRLPWPIALQHDVRKWQKAFIRATQA
jgi:hypothetical protein